MRSHSVREARVPPLEATLATKRAWGPPLPRSTSYMYLRIFLINSFTTQQHANSHTKHLAPKTFTQVRSRGRLNTLNIAHAARTAPTVARIEVTSLRSAETCTALTDTDPTPQTNPRLTETVTKTPRERERVWNRAKKPRQVGVGGGVDRWRTHTRAVECLDCSQTVMHEPYGMSYIHDMTTIGHRSYSTSYTTAPQTTSNRPSVPGTRHGYAASDPRQEKIVQ